MSTFKGRGIVTPYLFENGISASHKKSKCQCLPEWVRNSRSAIGTILFSNTFWEKKKGLAFEGQREIDAF